MTRCRFCGCHNPDDGERCLYCKAPLKGAARSTPHAPGPAATGARKAPAQPTPKSAPLPPTQQRYNKRVQQEKLSTNTNSPQASQPRQWANPQLSGCACLLIIAGILLFMLLCTSNSTHPVSGTYPGQTHMVRCNLCEGSGRLDGLGATVTCSACGGSGKVDADDLARRKAYGDKLRRENRSY